MKKELEKSALRELEAAARVDAAVPFALDNSAIAREGATLLENRMQVRPEVGQRLRIAVTHGASLTRQPTRSPVMSYCVPRLPALSGCIICSTGRALRFEDVIPAKDFVSPNRMVWTTVQIIRQQHI